MKKLLFIIIAAITFAGSHAQTKRGYEKTIELGSQFEIEAPSDMGGTFTTDFMFINGFRFNPYVFIGGGVGLDISTWNYKSGIYRNGESAYMRSGKSEATISMPIMFRGKYNFTKTKVSPFATTDLGVNMLLLSSYDNQNLENSYKRSGVFFNPAIGMDIHFNKKLSLYIMTGISILDQTENDYFNSYSITSFTTRVGLRF